MPKKICKICGTELKEGAEFCHNCGSKDVEITKGNSSSINKLICSDCGKELPLDSKFCQYCGSKNIKAVEVEEIKEEKQNPQIVEQPKTVTNTKLEPSKIEPTNSYTQPTAPVKTHKTGFIICLIAACIFGFLYLDTVSSQASLENEITNLNSQITTLNSKVKTAENNASNYKKKAEKYDTVSSTANQSICPDFRADTYFVKGTSKTIKIYCGMNANLTVQPEVISGYGIGWEWGSWTGSGYWHYCPMYITCSSGCSGVIKFTNTYNNHTFKVYVSAD